jgi:hypothetical protein
MWRHFCRAEGLPLLVASGEACNWCDAAEPRQGEPATAPKLKVAAAQDCSPSRFFRF